MDQAIEAQPALVEPVLIKLRLDRLEPNPWNPNKMTDEMLAKERASIERFGFVDPITVRRLPARMWQIIDGEHRWIVARQLKLTQVPCFDVGEIDDATAQQLTIVLNDTRGQTDPRKLGGLLSGLLKLEPKERLIATLPYSREAFERLTEPPKLDWADLPPMPKPDAPPEAWVNRSYRMPKAAAEVLDQAIARARESQDDKAADWLLLEMIAADFLGG